MGSGPAGDDDNASVFPYGDDELLPGSSKLSADRDRDGTPSSVESTPDVDAEAEPSQEPTQPPKRKGGRKPIYATSEERKQRNRQAQAAFRERRTEYIKQLEATIKKNEESLFTLQQSHRTAAEECLMLRYKNSLLERILLERGIDVQAELQMKTGGSPRALQPPSATIPPIPQPQSGLQRAAVQRQHARRSGQGSMPRATAGQSNPEVNSHGLSQSHPTPSSHASSPSNPSTQSPMMTHQSVSTPSMSGIAAQQLPFARGSHASPHHQAFYQQQMSPHLQRPSGNLNAMRMQNSGNLVSHHPTGSHSSLGQPMGAGNTTPGSSGSAYYPSPFQKHIDQLEQEYDIQESRSMLDQPEPDELPISQPDQMHGFYKSSLDQHPRHSDVYHGPMGGNVASRQAMASQQQQMSPQTPFDQKFDSLNPQVPPASFPPSAGTVPTPPNFGAMDIDPNDPMLNADPFGLSASMHYSTSYAYEPPPPPAQQQR